MAKYFSIGLGTGTTNGRGEWLEVFYPDPLLQADDETTDALLASLLAADVVVGSGNRVIHLESLQLHKLSVALMANGLQRQADIATAFAGSQKPALLTVLENDTRPTCVAEAYLKLHLLSCRLVKPHQVNLEGIFTCLPNVAWTTDGPVDLKDLADARIKARSEGRWLNVKSVDKFPPLTDYIVPSGVRIADTARVRLGAYIGEGTTIMHEGFINFNAGTEGASMVEGRISAGVFVGKGSDLGGGCSTMGTLSGGGNVVISIGRECLIGANAGVGIALGDRCTIEAGLYVTAGTKVSLVDSNGSVAKLLTARDLSGKSDLLFRRNSVSGSVECLTNRSAVELNEELHANN